MDITPNTNAGTAKHISAEENLKHLLGEVGLRFPNFKHETHGPVVDVNAVVDDHITLGQRIADKVASGMGSWGFIIIQSTLLVFWIILNLLAWIRHWDPYPFIFLNLALSFQAAYAAPIIMMSQNRQAAKDRLTAENDYRTNVKGEQEVCHVMDHLDHQDALTREILLRLEAQNVRLDEQGKLVLQIVQRLSVQDKQLESQHEEILSRLSKLEA